MVYIDDAVRITTDELLGEHLHITGQDDEVHPVAIEDLKLALFHFSLVVARHRDMFKRDSELLSGYRQIGMVADDDRNVDIPLPCHMACEHIVETMHVKYAVLTVDILVKIDDVSSVCGDEICYHCDNSRLIGTVHT